MRHLTEGALRRLVDEPAGVGDADRAHAAECEECLAGITAAQRDAAAVGSVLPLLSSDVDAGWERLRAAVGVQGRPVPIAAARRRSRLRSPLAAGLGVALLVSGATAAAAADWFQVFRTERIATVSITPADLVQIPDLSGYGTLELKREPKVREVPDMATAEKATGLKAPRVSELPRGVTGAPTYQVGDRAEAVFTFSLARATATARAAGKAMPPAPTGLDGSSFRLSAGPGLAMVWAEARGVPAMVVARAQAPTAFSSSPVSFDVARDYLLSMPGLPQGIASQLRDFSADGTTLPLPVPVQLVNTKDVLVGSLPATLITSKDGLMAGVIWVDGGIVSVVAGSLDDDEALAVARSL